MLKLRLKRVGRKHDPSFRIVVTESSTPAKGKYLESIGFYNPRTKQLELEKDRAQHWVSNGAQPTGAVHNILVREGVIDAPKIPVHSRKPSKKQPAEEEKAEAPAEEAKKEEATPEAEAPNAEEAAKEEPKEEKPKEEVKEEALAEETKEEKPEAKKEEEKPAEEPKAEATEEPKKENKEEK